MGPGSKCFLWAISLAAFLSAGQAFAEITPAASASRCTTPGESCPAPLAIFFSARGTTCTTKECDDSPFDNEAFHTLHYEWNFGDTGAGIWSVSGQDKNIEYGPLAAHVFDTAGAYNISVKINSGSESAVDTSITIYVDEPDVVFSGSNTLCVANGTTPVAGVGGCPSGADVLDSGDFDTAIEKAMAAKGGPMRVLFKANDEFTLDDEVDINYDGPGTIGSYGTANDGRAKVDATGTADPLFEANVSPEIDDWRFMDLEVTQSYAPGQWTQHAIAEQDGYSPNFAQTLFYRFKRISGGRFLSMQRTQDWDAPDNDYLGAEGIFAVDNEATGIYNVFHVAFNKGALLGNIITGQTPIYPNGNHLMRIGSPGRWEDMVISHNEFNCCSDIEITIRGEDNDTVTPSQFMVLRGNLLHDIRHDPKDNWGLLAIYPKGGGGSYDLIRDIIVENNRIESWLLAVAKTVTIRNNLFAPSYDVFAPININTFHACGLPDDWVDDLMIYNNSGYDTKSGQDMIWVGNGDGCSSRLPDAFYVRNNVYWNDDSSAEVYNCGSYCAGGAASNNIDRDDMPSTPYAADPPSINDSADWHLTGPSASVAIDAGAGLGSIVRLDFEYGLRQGAGAALDIGAIESDASPEDQTSEDVPTGGLPMVGQPGEPYCVKPDGSECS